MCLILCSSHLLLFLSFLQGTWSLRDKSLNFSSSPSLPWSPSWYINSIKASAQTTMACSCSVVLVLLCYWWQCGWSICGMTRCYVKSTPDSFTCQNPGPTTHCISRRTTELHLSRSVHPCVLRKIFLNALLLYELTDVYVFFHQQISCDR